MRKTARLDQILLTLGYTNQDEIARGLARQRAKGGRLGMNLVENGAIDIDQLLSALSEQYQLQAVIPGPKNIPSELLKKIPREIVFDHLILPLSWNENQQVLELVVAAPDEEEALDRVKEIFGARAVRLKLASDSRVMEVATELLGSHEKTEAGIELPELFGLEEAGDDSDEAAFGEERETPRKVLMVTGSIPRKKFLPPLFLREGVELMVESQVGGIAESLKSPDLDGILLSAEIVDDFSTWVEEGLIPEPESEVSVFPSVSGALLENPVPYETTVRSLRAAVQALAESRCAILGASPPYGLITSDLEALAHRHKMRRIVRDGLHLAAHLLLPGPAGSGDDPVGDPQPFSAFSSSLELATRIRFPWRIDWVLDACHALYSGRKIGSRAEKWGKEMRLAAQLMALVWYRHNHIPLVDGGAEEAMMALRTAIREKAGRLATLDVVESYLRLITDRGGALAESVNRQVLLVGGDRISRALAPGLSRVACQTVFTEDLADAQTLAERSAPGAIVLDHQEFPHQVEHFSRMAKLDGSALLFVLTDSTDPALVLNLLDIGVDDVFGPPHHFDLIAARIDRAIRSRAGERSPERATPGQFSATFGIFSFLDLIQALGQGRKSVRVELTRDDEEEAVIFLRKGQIVHATCGELMGAHAIYRVIAWEDEGEFVVRTETEFPETQIEESNESILMEGCRLLDESRR